MGGGGGGDGGYSERQAQIEAQKAEARKAVNRLFGVGADVTEPVYETQTGPAVRWVGKGADAEPIYGDPETTQVQVGTRTVPDAEAATNLAGREAGYGRVRDSSFDYHKQKIDDDAQTAGRKLKFALLRSGNAGGGLDIDQNSMLKRTYDKGILEAGNVADAASNQARSSDEASRLDLLSRIDAGMDQTSATQGAAAQLRASGDTALNQARGQSLGNFFDNAGLLYSANQVGQGKNDARQVYQSLYGKVPGASGGGYGGTMGRV